MSNFELSIHFFLQCAVILAACRVLGYVGRLFGQPQVVCEMIAGVVLGPSLFGMFAPEWQSWLFPKTLTVGDQTMSHPLMTVLYCMAQVGLALYMFLIGVEFRADLVRARARSAISVSLAGILAPFAIGVLFSLTLRDHAPLFNERVSLGEGALFMGAAMSITAFPMLARIIYERRMAGTSLGTLALAAGSMDDAAAWCLLAIVLASFSGDSWIAGLAIGGGVVYAFAVLFVIRPMLRPMAARVERTGSMTPLMLAMILTMAMAAAWLTDSLGVYAVFGTFILGAAMPRGRFAEELQSRIEPLTTSLLLPMFFVYSGLNTKIGLVNTPFLWIVTALILLGACTGKGVACWMAARLNGEPRRDALAIGALMNARGLMELIILNIGYDHGVITQTLFSMMVIMAVVTTLIATPLFELVYGRHRHTDDS